jgi:hypothetical protein
MIHSRHFIYGQHPWPSKEGSRCSVPPWHRLAPQPAGLLRVPPCAPCSRSRSACWPARRAFRPQSQVCPPRRRSRARARVVRRPASRQRAAPAARARRSRRPGLVRLASLRVAWAQRVSRVRPPRGAAAPPVLRPRVGVAPPREAAAPPVHRRAEVDRAQLVAPEARAARVQLVAAEARAQLVAAEARAAPARRVAAAPAERVRPRAARTAPGSRARAVSRTGSAAAGYCSAATEPIALARSLAATQL